MIPIEVYIVTIVVLLVVNYLIYIYGKKKGANDFAQLCFMAGLFGKTEAFANFNKYAKPGGIVFVGDSITQDFNVYEYFPDHLVFNRGIGGDTSKGVLTRLNESVFDLKPSKVFLNIGTNDLELIDDGIDNIYKRIKEIIIKIKAFDNKIEIFFISVYPVNPNMDKNTVGKRSNDNIKALNELVSKIEGIKYINLYEQLLRGDYLNPDYSIEGLHMNQNGYEIIKEQINKSL